jgi:hypothetical protein
LKCFISVVSNGLSNTVTVYEKVMNSPDCEFVIRMTYAELYNEELRDLLSLQPNENLKIVDDPHLGPTIQGITEAPFVSPAQIQKLLDEGEKSRHFGVTNMNLHSSRSHVLVRLSIEARRVGYKPSQPLRASWGKDKPTCVSTLNLVDLAGSERANKSGTSGQSLKEGSYINKSLLTLGTVISNLSEGKTGQHIPYRNSKLTRLLASALGGNAKTCVVTCISPASFNIGESLSTLRFASRAKRIVNLVHKNELLDVKTLSSKLANQMAEIDFLRSQLELSKQLGFSTDGESQVENLKSKTASARKAARCIRGLMLLVPKVVSAFKKVGQSHLAKKAQEDLKLVVSGGKEAAECLEEHAALLTAHLPREKTLITIFHDIEALNDAEELGDFSDDASGSLLNNLFPPTMKQLEASSEEVFAGLDFGSEELMEALESTRMGAEDFRGRASIVVMSLLEQLQKKTESELEKTKTIQELVKNVQSQHDQISRFQSSDSTLHSTIDDMKKKIESDHKNAGQQQQQLAKQCGDMSVKMTELNAEVLKLQQSVSQKDGDLHRERTKCEALNKELAANLLSRKQYEEDTIRARNEMKSQMDKLRSTMTSLLQQGGERSKVVEDENANLRNEVDDLKERLEGERMHKLQMDNEASHLRAEIRRQTENEKTHVKDLSDAHEQIAALRHKMNGLKFELTRITTVRDTEAEQAQDRNALVRRKL